MKVGDSPDRDQPWLAIVATVVHLDQERGIGEHPGREREVDATVGETGIALASSPSNSMQSQLGQRTTGRKGRGAYFPPPATVSVPLVTR